MSWSARPTSSRASATSPATTSSTARPAHPLGLRLLPDAARDQLPRPTGPAAAAGATSIPAQNNFAGIGTTGGGVPGDSFPDVSTRRDGADAAPHRLFGRARGQSAAARTREKQDDIIELSRRCGARCASTTSPTAGPRTATTQVDRGGLPTATARPTARRRARRAAPRRRGRGRPRPPPPGGASRLRLRGEHAQRAPAAPPPAPATS